MVTYHYSIFRYQVIKFSRAHKVERIRDRNRAEIYFFFIQRAEPYSRDFQLGDNNFFLLS